MIPTRYAIYFLPPPDAPWARFATAWLGWDCVTGQMVEPPETDLPADTIRAVTQTPRQYGLHATLKPPFRLHPDHDSTSLHNACAALAARIPPARADGLSLRRLGRFLALCPEGDTAGINGLAAACVTDLDAFRAPLSAAEADRRRQKADLSPEQDAMLARWGYPYVLDQFRFHITLTSRMEKPTRTTVETALAARLAPLLPRPFAISQIALVGEDGDGRFHLLHSYALTGQGAPGCGPVRPG